MLVFSIHLFIALSFALSRQVFIPGRRVPTRYNQRQRVSFPHLWPTYKALCSTCLIQTHKVWVTLVKFRYKKRVVRFRKRLVSFGFKRECELRSPGPHLRLSCFLNYITLCTCSDRLILMQTCLHSRYFKALSISARPQRAPCACGGAV